MKALPRTLSSAREDRLEDGLRNKAPSPYTAGGLREVSAVGAGFGGLGSGWSFSSGRHFAGIIRRDSSSDTGHGKRLHLPPDLSDTVSRLSKPDLAESARLLSSGCGSMAAGKTHLDF